jgi:hypothetical protein
MSIWAISGSRRDVLRAALFWISGGAEWQFHNSGSRYNIGYIFKGSEVFLDSSVLEYGNDSLSRNVGTQLSLYAAYCRRWAQILHESSSEKVRLLLAAVTFVSLVYEDGELGKRSRYSDWATAIFRSTAVRLRAGQNTDLFSVASRPPLRPKQVHIQSVPRDVSSWFKASGTWSSPLNPSKAERTNSWSCTSTLYTSSWRKKGQTYFNLTWHYYC